MGASSISGDLTLGTDGAIAQTGALDINGAAAITAGSGNILLNNASNDFTGAVSFGSGNDVTLRDVNALILGASTINGNFTLVTDGAITQTGALDENGNASITAGSGSDITLENSSNDFTGEITIVSGRDVSLADTNDVSMGAATAAGALTVSSGGDIYVTNTINTTAGGADGDILLKAAGGIVQNNNGTATALTTNGGDVILWADSDVNNSGSIHLGNDGTENLDLFPDSITTSGGTIVLAGGADDGANGGTGGDGIPDGFTVNPDYIGVEVDEEFTLNSGIGDIIIRGRSTFTGDDYGYGVYLDRGVDITGGDIYITGIGADSSHNYNSGVHMFSNDTLAGSIAASGNIVIDGTANVSSGAGGDNNDGIRISEYSVITAGGNISLAGRKNNYVGVNSDAVDMVGQLASTGGGTITLTGDTINLDYATASITSAGALVIKPETAGTTIGLAGGAGTLNLDEAELGKIQNGFSGITIGQANAGTVNISGAVTFNDNITLLTGSGIDIAGAVTAAENLIITSGGPVSQSDFLSVAGTTDINAGSQTVTLDNELNDFDSDNNGSLLTVDGGTVKIVDSDTLAIGTSNITTLIAESGDSLTLSGTITASGNLSDDNDTAIVLASGANFVESAGGDLDPGTGRFIVYSQDPGSDTLDDLTATPWYNAAYNSGAPTAVSGTGDRFAYSQTATLTVTAVDQSRTYGAANPTFTQTVAGYVNGETSSVLSGSAGSAATAATETTNVGTAVITASSGTLATDRNYNISTSNGTLTINTVPLTITADNQSKTYGDSLVLGTTAFTSSGLKNDETIGSVTLASSGSYDSNTSALAGTYEDDITTSNATGGTFTPTNYSITYNTGDLTVNTAELTITADNQEKSYGDTLDIGNSAFTAIGLKNDETIGSITLSSTGGYDTDTKRICRDI